MTTTLLLVRHGETIDNVNRIMQGQTQGELTETGVRQASNLAESLANTHIDIYMSNGKLSANILNKESKNG